MKKYSLPVFLVLLLSVCPAVLCSRTCKVLAFTESEQAELDNLTSLTPCIDNGTDSAAGRAYSNPPAYDTWYVNRMRRFPSFYYDPYYGYYYPFSDPYMGAYGQPWRYYDDYYDRDGDGHGHHENYENGLPGVFENMRERRQELRENFQDVMRDRHEVMRNQGEKIREGLQDLFSRERNSGMRDNRRDGFGNRFPEREHRGSGSGSGGPDGDGPFRGGMLRGGGRR